MAGAVLVGVFVGCCVAALLFLAALLTWAFKLCWRLLKWVWKQ